MELVQSLNSPTNPSPTENANIGQLQMELPLPQTQQAPIVNGWTVGICSVANSKRESIVPCLPHFYAMPQSFMQVYSKLSN